MFTLKEINENDKIETLDDLIEKKSKIITIIGVFGALTIFTTTLGDYPLITFGCLAILLILCWEFYKHIPKIERPRDFITTLNLFELLFFFGFLFPIYGYMAYFTFHMHPELKIIFSILFIAIPMMKFSVLILNNWMKNLDIERTSKNPTINPLWTLIISLFFVIPLELTYIVYRILDFYFMQLQ